MKDRNILLLNNISERGVSEFREGYHLTDDMGEAHGALVRSADMHEMEFSPSLRAIVRAGVGVDNIPLERCAEAGIVVMNTPGANANAVKELVICALMLSSRDIVGGIDWVRSHASDPDIENAAERAKKSFVGNEIIGKSIGVIGLGAIGVLVANACVDLGMEVYGYDPYISVGSAWRLKREVRHEESIDALLSECDYFTAHVPAVAANADLLNRDSFRRMKDGVKLLNYARGFIVNEDDVAEALSSGKIAKYVTDFATPKSVAMPNTVVMPHLGASTDEAEENCAIMAARELQDYLDNGNISHSENYPDVSAGRCRTASRIACLHHNTPGILGHITALMGECSVNIANLQNASRSDYAYTLMDIDERISDSALERLNALDSMIRVRIVR